MLDNRIALNDFLAQVQFRALKHAEIATGDRDDSMDIVQDCMLRLAQKYSDQPHNWPQLFQRILQNAIRDWYRKKKVRRILFWWEQEQTFEEGMDSGEGIINTCSTVPETPSPEAETAGLQISAKVVQALQHLPERQQQAFLLRAWWGNDIEETAAIMSCSVGSVKTHYFRAVAKLKTMLDEVL